MAANTETQTQSTGYIILDTIRDVLTDKADHATLANVSRESLKALDDTEANFSEAVERMAPIVKETCASLIESAHGFFEQIRIALGWVESFLTSSDKDALSTAANVIGRCNFQLDLLFVHLRNTAWSIQGPTEIPNLNAIIWANDFYQKDPTQIATLKELARGENRSAPAAIAELRQGPQTPEVEALRAAFEAHEDCALELLAALEANNKEDVAKEVDAMKITFSRIKDLVPAASVSQRTSGPTSSPQVNAVLSFTEDVIQNRVQDIVLMNALEVLYKDFLAAKIEFKQLTSRPADSVLLTEELQRVNEAYELQELAFRDYNNFFAERRLHVLQRGRDRMKEAADTLFECYKRLQEIAEREGKTLCIRCSHYNPAQRSHCEKCGMVLPAGARDVPSATFEAQEGEGIRPSQPTEGPVLTSNMVRIYRAVDKIADEQITDDEFLAEIAWFEGVLAKNADYTKNEPDLDSMSESERAFHEAVKKRMEEIDYLFQEALDEFDAAIERFRLYPETRDRVDLEEGVKLCDAAARKMVTVRDLPKTIPQSEEGADQSDSDDDTV